MWNILVKPLDSIAEAKKERNIGKTLLVLLVACVMLGVSFFFFFKAINWDLIKTMLLAIVVLYIVNLVVAYVYKITLNIFTKKNDYYLALTPMAYYWFIFSAGTLVGSILLLIPRIGPILAFLVMLWACAIAHGVWIKSTMEFYGTDVVTVIVAVVIVYVSFLLAAYFAVAGTLMNFFASLGGGEFSNLPIGLL